MLTSSRQLRSYVFRAALLSGIALSLAACETTGYVAVGPELPNLPPQIVNCLKGRVKTPVGDWTVAMVNDVISKYQRREDKLEGCMRDVIALYNSLQQGLRNPKAR